MQCHLSLFFLAMQTDKEQRHMECRLRGTTVPRWLAAKEAHKQAIYEVLEAFQRLHGAAYKPTRVRCSILCVPECTPVCWSKLLQHSNRLKDYGAESGPATTFQSRAIAIPPHAVGLCWLTTHANKPLMTVARSHRLGRR